jgi:hypothetical protein
MIYLQKILPILPGFLSAAFLWTAFRHRRLPLIPASFCLAAVAMPVAASGLIAGDTAVKIGVGCILLQVVALVWLCRTIYTDALLLLGARISEIISREHSDSGDRGVGEMSLLTDAVTASAGLIVLLGFLILLARAFR